MRDGRWRYTIKAYKRGKDLVLETTHQTESSRDMEIAAFKSRMARGEISHVEVISHVEPYGVETIYR